MVDFGGLKFEASDEPIVRNVGRKKAQVPAEIKQAVSNAIKTGKTLVIELPTNKVGSLRRLLKQAVSEAGNYKLNTQEVPNPDTKQSIFRFSVEAKPSE